MNKTDMQAWITGVILFNPNFINYVNLPSIVHLFSDPCRTIIEAVLFLGHNNSKDLFKLIDYLRISDKLDSIGGESFLIGLQNEIPDNTTIKTLTKRILMLRR